MPRHEPIGGCSETARVGLQYAHRKRREAQNAETKESFEDFLARVRAEVRTRTELEEHAKADEARLDDELKRLSQ